MKFATYVAGGVERFGIVVNHPANGETWVFDPEETEERLRFYASRPTSPYLVNRPVFLAQRPWPRSLVEFLALGDAGMDAAQRLQDYLLSFLRQSDQALMAGAGHRLNTVTLRAPIPRPRLFFGLVQNSPTFMRFNDKRPVVNVYPQGHQRPQGSLVSPNEAVYLPPEMQQFGWNPEPGLIIGRGGRDIPVDEAMQHVAGFTLVMDIAHHGYVEQLAEAYEDSSEWFVDATGSWLGKKSDTFASMGPFLTTKDEVGNPYDLLLTTRQSGWLRDRAHTGALVIGYEKLVSWLSSFMTLQPGDVIHMGTLAVDGMPYHEDMRFCEDDYIEGEWEKVGRLRLPVVMAAKEDWRDEDDPGRRVHPVPAVRDLIESSEDVIPAPEAWSLDGARHFWTVYDNYRGIEAIPGKENGALPRLLNCPASALASTGSTVHIPRRATELRIGVELAFVVSRVAHRVAEEEADDYVLGYVPLAVLNDRSFAEPIRQPASTQEAAMPDVYCRWADGFNIAGGPPVAMRSDEIAGRTMRLAVDGYGELECSTDEYLLRAPRILALLTQWITVFPGDVVTLGRTGNMLAVPAGTRLGATCTLTASVEGIGQLTASFADEREDVN